MNLVRYEQARTALAECHRVDEVKDIRDKAEAMAAYARQAKDQELILWATEIKVRAERKAGEMLRETKASGERASGGMAHLDADSYRGNRPVTLGELGITGNESSHWQSLASMSEEHFETAVATAKETAGQVTTAFMLREAGRHRPDRKPSKAAQARLNELKRSQDENSSVLVMYARMCLKTLRETESLNPQERTVLGELHAELTTMFEKVNA